MRSYAQSCAQRALNSIETRGERHARSGRGDRIRTCDLLVPNQALYQAKLHPAQRGSLYHTVARDACETLPVVASARPHLFE